MQGDNIIIGENHRRTASVIVPKLLPAIEQSSARYTISVAGESGSGKSETAAAIADELEKSGIKSIILQQDDYFVYPPLSNDRHRRKDISWVGQQEVRLAQLDDNLHEFLENKEEIHKPLVIYKEDRITDEVIRPGDARVAIAEGTYTTLLMNINTHIFIDRNYMDTREHRVRRSRHASELDEFTDEVLKIEHKIISAQRDRAEIILDKDYAIVKMEI